MLVYAGNKTTVCFVFSCTKILHERQVVSGLITEFGQQLFGQHFLIKINPRAD